jgi:hypothetical protein
MAFLKSIYSLFTDFRTKKREEKKDQLLPFSPRKLSRL